MSSLMLEQVILGHNPRLRKHLEMPSWAIKSFSELGYYGL